MAHVPLAGILVMFTITWYTLLQMTPYLTDVWGLGLTRAAGILNIFWGLFYILRLLWKFLNDTCIRNFWAISISSIALCAGMGFLWMSSPPVLSNITGTCGKYKPECIGNEQKLVFYIALSLIAFALSGLYTCYDPFLIEQLSRITGEIRSWQVARLASEFWGLMNFTFILSLNLIVVIGYIHPWAWKFGLPAIFSLVATLLFVIFRDLYHFIDKPEGSPLTMIARVIVASASKSFYRSPTNNGELFESDCHHDLLLHTKSLRCLDKAAIVIPTQPLEEQQKNRWKLCRVTEVEETKIIIRSFPVWMTFILCGVVSSIGTTYFVAQLDHLNPEIGRLKGRRS